jgi:hypothetical protein
LGLTQTYQASRRLYPLLLLFANVGDLQVGLAAVWWMNASSGLAILLLHLSVALTQNPWCMLLNYRLSVNVNFEQWDPDFSAHSSVFSSLTFLSIVLFFKTPLNRLILFL